MTVFFVYIVVIGIFMKGKGHKKMRLLSVLALSAVLVGTGSLSAQSRRATASRAAIPDIQLTTRLVNAPNIQVLDKPDGSGPLGKSKKWLQFQISYKFSASAVSAKRIYEDMKVEFYLRHPVTDGGYAWFTGVQNLHCVIADYEKHYVALYMPPSTVYRYISQDTKIKSVVKNLQGIVIISDRDDNVLGMHFFDLSTGKSLSRSQAAALRNAYKNINQAKYKFVDAIWAKENTPWQWIDAEKYDLPKPVFNHAQKLQAKEAPAAEKAEEENGE